MYNQVRYEGVYLKRKKKNHPDIDLFNDTKTMTDMDRLHVVNFTIHEHH